MNLPPPPPSPDRPGRRLWPRFLLALLLLPLAPAVAHAQGIGLRHGGHNLGIGLAAGSGYLTAAGSYGYFVTERVELGGAAEVFHGDQALDYGLLGPYVRRFALTEPPLLPFVKIAASRLFIQDVDDGWLLHGGVGLGLLLGRGLLISAEVYREYQRSGGTDGWEPRNDYRLGLNILF